MASNTYTLLRVVQAAGFRLGKIKASITADQLASNDVVLDELIEMVNKVQRTIAKVRGLPQLGSRYSFNTVAPYTTGTAATATDDATVTGTTTTWDTSWKDERVFMLDSDATAYRISSVTGVTSLELETEWAGTGVATTAYTIAKDRYTLPNAFSDIHYAGYDGPSTGDIDIRMPSEVDRIRYAKRGTVLSTGAPTKMTVYRDATNDVWIAEFDPAPDDEYHITLRTVNSPTTLDNTDGSTTVQVDDENIDILIDGVVAAFKDIDTPGAFESWVNGRLRFHATFDRKMFDENPRLVPDNVVRNFDASGSRTMADTDYLQR